MPEEQNKSKNNNYNLFSVRVPTSMIKQVESAVSNCVGITRNGWILQAIHEKLKKG